MTQKIRERCEAAIASLQDAISECQESDYEGCAILECLLRARSEVNNAVEVYERE